MFPVKFWVAVVLIMLATTVEAQHRRILLDTDVDTDDVFALLYLLKLNKSEFQLEGVTVNANAWTNVGHSVNQVYDILYMMGRDDIAVGMGGEGGILPNGTILPNVGGYLSIIEQGMTTTGGCRYRQAIPMGFRGLLDIDTNYGIRKAFLPQGRRKYTPLRQPTAQEVLIDKISAGPITLIVIGVQTNIAIFLMNNPHLKKNVEHIYIMGGSIRSRNTGCCSQNASSSCFPKQCDDLGNLFTNYKANPYAEFNIFGDPFAAYQVIHSGIPITLVPLDATNTIPITEEFFNEFEKSQDTYEAQYCFKSLKMAKMARETWLDNQFYRSYFMWDSFASGVAISSMRNSNKKSKRENEFADMEYINITVVTSNKPYGICDGSNPFFDGLKVPKFNLKKGGVHSGHVQQGLRDQFCFVKNGKGRCQDGYTSEENGPNSVKVLVATNAKPNQDVRSPLDKEYFKSFLNVLKQPQNAGRFNFTTQFPYYKEAIIVSPTGWTNAATIDVIYDLLHMMGRDDIPVGLGEVFAMNESNPFPLVGDCKYAKAIPHGNGGFLDSDTLYGLARDLPRSPKRYTPVNSMKFEAPQDADYLNLRQPLAMEIWESVLQTMEPRSKITVLTNGPLTTLAKVVSLKNISSRIEEVYVVGGHISKNVCDKGNVFSVPSNQYAEFNMFLDPLAAKIVFQSEVNITLIPLNVQHKASSFSHILCWLRRIEQTPEVVFSKRVLLRLQRLKQSHHRYQHMDTFLGEILGAVVLADNHSSLSEKFEVKPVKVLAQGDVSIDGEMVVDEEDGKLVRILSHVNSKAYHEMYANRLGDWNQSAKVRSFEDQRRKWSHPHSS